MRIPPSHSTIRTSVITHQMTPSTTSGTAAPAALTPIPRSGFSAVAPTITTAITTNSAGNHNGNACR